MKYQKILTLLHNQTTQSSRFGTKNGVEINDDRPWTYDKKNLKFKTLMLNTNLCHFSDVYILVRGKVTAVGQGVNGTAIAADRNDKEVVFKNCAPFTSCISKINNAEADNAEDLDIVMPMFNSLEYRKIMQKHQLIYDNIVEMNQMIT